VGGRILGVSPGKKYAGIYCLQKRKERQRDEKWRPKRVNFGTSERGTTETGGGRGGNLVRGNRKGGRERVIQKGVKSGDLGDRGTDVIEKLFKRSDRKERTKQRGSPGAGPERTGDPTHKKTNQDKNRSKWQLKRGSTSSKKMTITCLRNIKRPGPCAATDLRKSRVWKNLRRAGKKKAGNVPYFRKAVFVTRWVLEKEYCGQWRGPGRRWERWLRKNEELGKSRLINFFLTGEVTASSGNKHAQLVMGVG